MEALIAEHHLNVTETLVVSSWANPIPMVLHHSSRFTEFGEIFLAMILLLVVRLLAVGLYVAVGISIVCALAFSWFLFRLYYDIRFFSTERMILLPPTANDNTLLHELLHIQQGHIERMSSAHRLLAVSPLGPIEYLVRTLRHDYGGEGVVGELQERAKANSVPYLTPGLLTFGCSTLIFFVLFVNFTTF